VLVDPFSIDSIAFAMGRVIDDSDFRKKLRVKGLDRARRFSWQQTAQRTLDVYRKAAGSSLTTNSPMHKVRSVS
jgi:glycosyltransferase involved in cell wall biosynthesis